MSKRLKIPISLYKQEFSALKANGFGNVNGNAKKISGAEKQIIKVLQPDLDLKLKLDRVFDLKGGDG